MNENDSEVLAGVLEQRGYQEVTSNKSQVLSKKNTEDLRLKTFDLSQADIVLVNTCSIREKAEHKALSFINKLKKIKRKKPNMIVGLCGCMAQRQKEKWIKKLPFVDIIMGPQGIYELSALLDQVEQGQRTVTFFNESCATSPVPIKRTPSVNAWVTIMYGCNNYCSYCVVPYVRGPEKSRSVKDIITEIKGLDKKIYKEVTLLGQNVNSYAPGDLPAGRQDEKGLAFLLAEVSKIKRIERIRFVTSHPKDMTDEILFAVRDLPKVCEYIHMPAQSGSTKILEQMNRKYDRDYYIKLVKKIRKIIPDVSITSDFMVGFPGETEKDFRDTLDLIKQCKFEGANTFAFSNRLGTKAAELKGHLPENIKKQRLAKLHALVEKVAKKANKRYEGKEVEILVDSPTTGRTRGNKVVQIPKNTRLIGKLIKVTIKSVGAWGMKAI